jgi:hypothetical protein
MGNPGLREVRTTDDSFARTLDSDEIPKGLPADAVTRYGK